MKDIISANNGEDLGVQDSIVPKAGNILSVQQASLKYAQDLGVDLAYFLSPEFQFQNDSFKSYLVQRLTEQQVNVSKVIETLEAFIQRLTFVVAETKNTGGLIL